MMRNNEKKNNHEQRRAVNILLVPNLPKNQSPLCTNFYNTTVPVRPDISLSKSQDETPRTESRSFVYYKYDLRYNV